MALQDKDLKIKDLEVKNSELLQDGKDQKLKDLELRTTALARLQDKNAATLRLNGLEVHNHGGVEVQDEGQLQPSISRKTRSKRKLKWLRPFRKKSEPEGRITHKLLVNDNQCSIRLQIQ